MLRRKMYDRLLDWKSSDSKKVLLLQGARQTGKTFIVDEFARNNYESYIKVNFFEDEESGAFLAGAESANELISRLSLITGRGIQPGTLIFFDEVQHLGANIVTLSKFLLEDGRFDLILSGSLLGVALTGVMSFPVGYARIEHMFPLDFEEYCWAVGVPESVLDLIREAYRTKLPLEEELHKRLIRIFREYLVVGGMPEAVQRFLDHRRELGESRAVLTDILEQYRYDIIKYSGGRQAQILSIFDNMPGQLAKVNKRFMLNTLKKGAAFERFEDDFTWLSRAGVALEAHLVTEPKEPLLRTRSNAKFKLYSSDCGLLLAQYPLASSRNIIAGEGDGNFGAVYENAVAQQLISAGYSLFYYNNNRKGEVDFLIATADGTIIPIEVKSGKDYKLHTALNNLLGSKEYSIPFAYVLSEANVSVGMRQGKPVYYLPLYMTIALREEQGDGLANLRLEAVDFSQWE